MKVRLLKKETVELFLADHSNYCKEFEKWQFLLEIADWETPDDIMRTIRGNLLGKNRLVFDVGGNGPRACRVICEYMFGRKMVHIYINWIGTHEDYNHLSAEDKMTVDNY